MKMILTGAALLVGLALATPATAAPGQCSITGFDSFACDLSVDGGGLTFALPDGNIFVFAHTGGGNGIAYLVTAGAAPGSYPEELGMFSPVSGEDGCWAGGREDITFCAALVQ